MAFKRNGSLMKHDAAGAAAFWARWYLERENWTLSHKPEQPVRMKVSTDEEHAEDDVAAYEDTWPSSKHH
jgi:hypothetical protein